MYDPEDIRYSKGEERPPWELSPQGRFREWFSCRKVDSEGDQYCREVEEQKRERAQARAQRVIRHQQERDRQAQQWAQERARRQARMDAQRAAQSAGRQPGQEEEPPSTPPKDPRGSRYQYPSSSNLSRARRGKVNAVGVAVIVCLALVISLAMQLGFSNWQEEPVYDDWYGGEWYEENPEEDAPLDPDWEQQPWRTEEDSAAEAEEEPAELKRAELTGELTVEIRSDQGKTPLTYQQLYTKCLPSTVSITVVTDEGVGTGTGIVMTEDGYILTCNHVIADGVTCRVTTSEDETYEALLVGGDAQTDLAILKIEAQGLIPAEFGDSDELTVGDEALAIGDPLGTELRGTLTNGIISAINRNVTVNSYSMTLLQTTAALNSGNSGGPLLNIYGQVVGVNNMKMNSTVVTVEGLGFAVPTSVVREIVPVLSTQGKVSRPVLGITCYGIDQETAERNGEPVAGLRVAVVNQRSDAYAQGLEEGDYITAVNGTPVVSVDEVKEIIQDLSIGDTVELEVYRIDQETGEDETFSLIVALVDQSELS